MRIETTAVSNETVTRIENAEVLRYAAFPDGPRGGNPAGVVLNASGLTDGTRLGVAAQVGYSETAFVEADDRGGQFHVRFFSPLAEVAFCGHATIATAVALAQRHGVGRFVFHTLAGPIEVDTELTTEGYVATLRSVATRTRAASTQETTSALNALRWRPDELDPRYPPHVAYAGNEHLVLAARHRSRLAELDYDYKALEVLMAERGWTTLQLVHAHTPKLFSARNPFPPGGVIEDPATGAAAAAFGGYLRALNLVDLPAHITLLQGEDMGQPSRLLVQLDSDDDRVRVTGAATEIRSPPMPRQLHRRPRPFPCASLLPARDVPAAGVAEEPGRPDHPVPAHQNITPTG